MKSTVDHALQSIEKNRWNMFLSEFTGLNRGAHARLEVLGEAVGYQVALEGRPFDGVFADVKDGEQTVWIAFGPGPADHMTHGVHNVTAIRAHEPSSLGGAALEVESRDGTKTVLELTSPDTYALPPAATRSKT